MMFIQDNLVQRKKKVTFSIHTDVKKKFQTRDNSFQRVCLTSSFPTGKTILLANNAIITSSQSFTTRRKCYVFRFIHSNVKKVFNHNHNHTKNEIIEWTEELEWINHCRSRESIPFSGQKH
jgi:hypothetical protein